MSNNQNDISLKDLILGVKKYIYVIKKGWLFLLLSCIISLAYFVNKTFTTKPYYLGQITYITGEGGGGGMGALGGLLGNFGIRNSGKTNPNEVITVSKSKELLSRIMFRKSSCNDDYLANSIIDVYDLDKKWEEMNPDMANFRFKSSDYLNFKGVERSAFLSVLSKILGPTKDLDKALLLSNYSDETGLYNLNSKSESECLTIDLVNYAYHELKNIFELELQEERKKTLELLGEKRDSIYAVINAKTQEIGRFQEQNRGLVSAVAKLQAEKIQLEIRSLGVAYAEANKSYEITDISNKTSKPTFSILERPYAPLFPFAQKLILNIVIALLVGAFIGVVLIIISFIYREALNS